MFVGCLASQQHANVSQGQCESGSDVDDYELGNDVDNYELLNDMDGCELGNDVGDYKSCSDVDNYESILWMISSQTIMQMSINQVST